jgi:hypothetical protein
MRRWTFFFLPLLAGLAFFYGVFWTGKGGQLVFQGEEIAGIILGVFGIAGMAVGLALWAAWRNRSRNL